MIPKFLNDNELKMSLKKYSYCFKVHRSYSISFNLYNCRQNFLRLNPKGPYLGLRQRKRKFLCCVHLLHKASAKILAIFMSQSRSDGKENVEKSMMHLQTCCFANIHLFQERLSERTANGNCRMEIVRPKGSVGFEY